jgi:hypothetical protein
VFGRSKKKKEKEIDETGDNPVLHIEILPCTVEHNLPQVPLMANSLRKVHKARSKKKRRPAIELSMLRTQRRKGRLPSAKKFHFAARLS